MQQAINVMTRISELAIQAANDTNGVPERIAIRTEVEQLANVMLEIANTRDAQGQSLFAGYHTNSQAFIKNVDGTFTYKGDRGKHTLQISESMNVATSIDGGTAFETVDTGKGRKSVFDIISNTINTIGNASMHFSTRFSTRLWQHLTLKFQETHKIGHLHCKAVSVHQM